MVFETIECVAKKWGSSIGIIVPKDIVRRKRIKQHQKILVSVETITLAKDLWNLGPIIERESTQKIKDELRRGW